MTYSINFRTPDDRKPTAQEIRRYSIFLKQHISIINPRIIILMGSTAMEAVTGSSEKISNEISTTSGYEFNKNNSVLATSGNNKFKFDIKQQGFAWMTSSKKENIMVKVMKKGSRIMIAGYNEKGSQTIDHYSLLGFTKAYNTAKKTCS